MIYSSFEAHELARFCDREQVDMLVLPTAWLMPEEDLATLESRRTTENQQPSLPLLNYWVMRTLPLWLPGASESPVGRTTYMVACNRTGKEIGTSSHARAPLTMQIRSLAARRACCALCATRRPTCWTPRAAMQTLCCRWRSPR